MGLCTCLYVPDCVRVSGMPKAKCAAGEGHRPTSTAAGLIAMRQKVRRLHATPHDIPRKISHKCGQIMQHAFTSLQLSKPQLFPPTQPTNAQLPSRPTFTIQAAVHPHKESILNPTGLILPIDRKISLFFFGLYIFTFMNP